MNRHLLLPAAALAAALLAGCATPGDTASGDSELVERIRQELALDPLLNTSGVTLTERDGTIVVGGFVDKLEDLNEIRDAVEGVDGVTSVENNVVVQPD